MGAAVLFGSLGIAVVAGLLAGFRGVGLWWLPGGAVAVPLAVAIASRFASNAPLAGSEDMSWRILLLVIAAGVFACFFAAFALAALLRLLWRGSRTLPGHWRAR